jgi:hypothetical protein
VKKLLLSSVVLSMSTAAMADESTPLIDHLAHPDFLMLIKVAIGVSAFAAGLTASPLISSLMSMKKPGKTERK